MPTDGLTPHEILEKLYSSEGYYRGAASVRLDGFCNVKVFPSNDGLFSVKFEEPKPVIKIGNTLSVKTTISGIILGENGGSIEVDRFPDVPFRYSWIMGDSEQVVGFDKGDLVDIFSRAAAQKLINSLIDAVVDSVVATGEDSSDG